MSKLAESYNESYGAIVSPHADIEHPFGWIPAICNMLERLANLPTELRAYFILTRIYQDCATGLLEVAIGAFPKHMTPGRWDRVWDIIQDTRNLLAWTCETDGNEGWLVHGKIGPTILCPTCQANLGYEPHRHGA